MLIELWERLRGYNKWVQAEARVDSAAAIRRTLGKRYQESPTSRASGRLLVWKDQLGKKQVGVFVTLDTSPFYQLLDGETITIRYNPARPNHYYCRAHLLSWLVHLAKISLVGFVSMGFFVWLILRIIEKRGL